MRTIGTVDLMEQTNDMQIQWKYVFRRTGAYIADAVFVYLLTRIIRKAAPNTAVSVGNKFFQNVIFALYAVVLTALLRGRTVGKLFFHLKVVDLDGRRPGFMRLLIREFTGRFLLEASNLILLAALEYFGVLEGFLAYCGSFPGGTVLYYLVSLPWVLVISYSCVMLRKDHMAIHDRISGTKVIS